VRDNRSKPLVEITNKMNTRLNMNLSQGTVRRYMAEAGYHSHKVCKKPLTSEKNVKARLEWCKKRQSWSTEWREGVWADESLFCLFGCDRQNHVWRKVGERYRLECVKKTVKHGGGSVMVWGCMSWQGPGPLGVIEDTLDGNGYIELLSSHLVPYLEQVRRHVPGVMLYDDNARCHVAGPVAQYEQAHGIHRSDWPAQSPDLNPIEHLWDYLDRQVRKREHLPTSRAEMVAALQEEWSRIPLDVVRNLISSMPNRTKAVIDAKGGPTRY
jgi:transposase